MINKTVELSEIKYVKKEYDDHLYESIHLRGIAIPIKVIQVENGYECIDGHKRLSICCDLAKDDTKFLRIPVMITNDFSKAGSSFWGNTLNHH